MLASLICLLRASYRWFKVFPISELGVIFLKTSCELAPWHWAPVHWFKSHEKICIEAKATKSITLKQLGVWEVTINGCLTALVGWSGRLPLFSLFVCLMVYGFFGACVLVSLVEYSKNACLSRLTTHLTTRLTTPFFTYITQTQVTCQTKTTYVVSYLQFCFFIFNYLFLFSMVLPCLKCTMVHVGSTVPLKRTVIVSLSVYISRILFFYLDLQLSVRLYLHQNRRLHFHRVTG